MNRILTLSLTHFRNHTQLQLAPQGCSVILTGPNGAGKTNVLEAVSLLSPGRGLRKAKLGDMTTFGPHPRVGGKDGGQHEAAAVGERVAWTVAARCSGLQGHTHIGTASDRSASSDRRVVRIDGENVSQNTLSRHLAILWQTPQMDGLFLGSGSDRRAFLDRLVYSADAAHAARVNAYEKAMRERNRLLADEAPDNGWLEALEQRMAGEGEAIARAREETVARLNAAMQHTDSAFPKARLAIHCEVTDAPAFAAQLARARPRDAAAGRALGGVHRAALSAFHIDKNREAGQCSTGEQKAVLLSILLAHARARARCAGAAPVLLLDEVVAHLDETRRRALFEAIAELGAQAWLTGTDAGDFSAAGDGFERCDFKEEKSEAWGASPIVENHRKY